MRSRYVEWLLKVGFFLILASLAVILWMVCEYTGLHFAIAGGLFFLGYVFFDMGLSYERWANIIKWEARLEERDQFKTLEDYIEEER